MIPRFPIWVVPLLLPVMIWKRFQQSVFLHQLASGYAVQFFRVLNWAIAAALVYRWEGEVAFAAFSLARAMILVLNYAAIGIGPALVILLPQMKAEAIDSKVESTGSLEYAHPPQPLRGPSAAILMWRTGLRLSTIPLALLGLLIAVYAMDPIQARIPDEKFWSRFTYFFIVFGLGACFRLIGDAAGARLQVAHRIGIDNLLQSIGELLWIPLALLLIPRDGAASLEESLFGLRFYESIAASFAIASFVSMVLRWSLARRDDSHDVEGSWNTAYAKLLLLTGGAMLFGQLADFLYAPANQLIIKRVLGEQQLAVYAPALYVDGILLLLVSGLSMILLPKTAIAYHHKKWNDLRLYYVLGTSASLVLLVMGAVIFCLLDDRLFRFFFGNPLPATQAILPLVLIHTVAGGSASIGRSVLFGMGKVKPYAIAAIIGGVANVGLAILLVTTTDLGLHGIIYATIFTVVFRCLIWLPIYTLWSIRQVGGPLRIRWN